MSQTQWWSVRQKLTKLAHKIWLSYHNFWFTYTIQVGFIPFTHSFIVWSIQYWTYSLLYIKYLMTVMLLFEKIHCWIFSHENVRGKIFSSLGILQKLLTTNYFYIQSFLTYSMHHWLYLVLYSHNNMYYTITNY